MITFDKARFLRYFRWAGRVYLNSGATNRERNRCIRHRLHGNNSDWSSWRVRDVTRHYTKHAVNSILWLWVEVKGDEARAWQLWQRRWPKEFEKLVSELARCQSLKQHQKQGRPFLTTPRYFDGGNDEPVLCSAVLANPGHLGFYSWLPGCRGSLTIEASLSPAEKLRSIRLLKEARVNFSDIQGPVKVCIWLRSDWSITEPAIKFEASRRQEVA